MHLEPSDKNARRLFERGIEGPVTMLNLLRFRAALRAALRAARLSQARGGRRLDRADLQRNVTGKLGERLSGRQNRIITSWTPPSVWTRSE
jgi:hypothetical protein